VPEAVAELLFEAVAVEVPEAVAELLAVGVTVPEEVRVVEELADLVAVAVAEAVGEEHTACVVMVTTPVPGLHVRYPVTSVLSEGMHVTATLFVFAT
jgi:hypothetical protein